jgi:hypothetical protein
MKIQVLGDNKTFIYKGTKYKYGELFSNLLNYKFNNIKSNIDFVKDFKKYENIQDIECILNDSNVIKMLNCFSELVTNPCKKYIKVRRIDASLFDIINNNKDVFNEIIFNVKIDVTTLNQYIRFVDLKDFIVYDIFNVLKSGLLISSCINCHKLFFNDKRPNIYCSKKCSNQYNYQQEMNNRKKDPLINTFYRCINRYYSRTTKYEENYNRNIYEDWLEKVNDLKEKYLQKKITAREFEDFLNIDPFKKK